MKKSRVSAWIYREENNIPHPPTISEKFFDKLQDECTKLGLNGLDGPYNVARGYWSHSQQGCETLASFRACKGHETVNIELRNSMSDCVRRGFTINSFQDAGFNYNYEIYAKY